MEEESLLTFHFSNHSQQQLFVYLFCLEETGHYHTHLPPFSFLSLPLLPFFPALPPLSSLLLSLSHIFNSTISVAGMVKLVHFEFVQKEESYKKFLRTSIPEGKSYSVSKQQQEWNDY